MIRLHLLGSQQLERGGESLNSVVAQPKRFALLAYLALAGRAFVRRDTVLAVFWPELDQFAARRALRNSVYQLRRAIGVDVFRNRGDEELAVDPDAVWCDAVALEAATEEGRFEDAVALYRGELLRGFQLPGCEDAFGVWLLGERERALRHVLRALEALYTRDSAGQPAAAARWAARANEIAPLDETWRQRAVATPAASEDHGTAVRPPAPTARRSLRLVLGAIGAVLVVGALVGVVASARSRRHADPHRLLVTVLQNRTGDPRLETLGDMASDWVSRGLFATGLGEVIDPSVLALRGRTARGQPSDPFALARLTGAGTIVDGYYYRSADSLLFAVSIADANSGRVLGHVGPVGGPIARPSAALDDLRSRVMTALSIALDPRFAEQAEARLRPPPFPAYDAYIRGSKAFWVGDYPKAESLVRESVRLDSAFGHAAVGLAVVASNSGRCVLADSVSRSWPAERAGLSEADRLTLAIAVAHCHGQADEALRLTLTRARLLPRSSSALLMSADAALWADRPGETLAILHTVNPAIDLAWALDSIHAHSLFFEATAEADHRLGRYDDELEVAHRLPPGAALPRAMLEARAFVSLGRRRQALDAVERALALPADPEMYWGLVPATEGRPQYSATGGWVAAWIAREFFVHGDSAAGRAVATRTLTWLDGLSRDQRIARETRFLEATMRDLTGDYAGERTVLRGLLADDSTNIDVRGLMAGAAAAEGDTSSAAAGDTWLAHLPGTQGGWAAPLYRARIAARQGRVADAIGYLRLSRAAGAWPQWVHCDPAVFSLIGRPEYRALMTPVG